MLRNKYYITVAFVMFLSGCTTAPTIVPEDFIIVQDTRTVRGLLSELKENDYIVKFKRGKSQLFDSQIKKLNSWLESVQPAMLTVRGTGGAEKYRELGLERDFAIVNHILQQGYDFEIISLDYDPDLPGGRSILNIVPEELAYQVRIDAPIMIVNSN